MLDTTAKGGETLLGARLKEALASNDAKVKSATAAFEAPANAPARTTELTKKLLEELLKSASGKRKTLIVFPVMAQYILDNHNLRNSKIQHTAVDTYAADMASGRWLYNAEPITFDDEGNLTSGQHRLMASVKSNTPFLTDMVFGLDPEIRTRRNSGKKDKPGDYLATAGWKNPNVCSNAIRWVTLYNESEGASGSRRTIPAVHFPEIGKTLNKRLMESSASRALVVHRQCPSIPAQYLAALFYKISEQSPDEAEKFIKAWVDGKPVSIARKCQKLFNERANDKTRNKSGDDWQKFVTLILTWNNYIGPHRSDRRDIDSWNVSMPVPTIAS